MYKWDGRGLTDDPHKVDAGKGVIGFVLMLNLMCLY